MMMNYELSRLCDGEMYVKNKYPSWSDVLDFLNILKKNSLRAGERFKTSATFGKSSLK